MKATYMLKVNKRGYVGYCFRIGNSFLHDLMKESVAIDIIRNGNVVINSTIEGLPICVDYKYYIEEVKVNL